MKEKVRRWRKVAKERKNVGNELVKQRGDGEEKLLESWEEGEREVAELAGQEVELSGAVGGGVEVLMG